MSTLIPFLTRWTLVVSISLNFLSAQNDQLSSSGLELISVGSSFENNIHFTIGETFTHFMAGDNIKIQEGFLQTNLFSAHQKSDQEHISMEFNSTDAFVFPNPTSGILRLQVSEHFFNNYPLKYNIFNGLGLQCSSGILQDQQKEIDLRNLPTGIYFLQVLSEKPNLNSSIKIIKI